MNGRTHKRAKTGNANPELFNAAYTHSPAIKLATIQVGKYHEEYPLYRKATAADWENPTFQKVLREAYQKDGEWSLLEDPLKCVNILYVAEGNVMINGGIVESVRYDDRLNSPFGYYHTIQEPFNEVRKKYVVFNNETILNDLPLPDTPDTPLQERKWTVNKYKNKNGLPSTYNPSCLYVHESYITPAAPAAPAAAGAAAPGGGSRRSRRHKRRNYVKKQKKRTRKH